jgi:hypothetical protein
MRAILVAVFAILFSVSETLAQCAMCRSTLENNVSNGNPGIAAGINTGILYLLVIPYIAVTVLAYLWYKTSKNARKKVSGSVGAG